MIKPALAALAASAASATECASRKGVAGDVTTSCRGHNGEPPQQFRTRQAVGGSTITTGNGTTCTTRPTVGGGAITTCR